MHGQQNIKTPLHVTSTVLLIISRSQLFYTASGIVTPVGGRPVRTGRPPAECDDTRCCIIQFDLLMMSTTVLETFIGI